MCNFVFDIGKLLKEFIIKIICYKKESNMVYRRFLPVGQGAFYLEQFKTDNNKINIIYDCGSLKNFKIVKKQIENNFSEKEEILIVFISHLDADHVNGLEFLLQHCNVKNIVFPLINSKDRFILSVNYLCSTDEHTMDDFTYKLIRNTNETLKKSSESTRVIYVDENKDNHIDDYNYRYYNEYLQNNTTINIFSGQNIFKFIGYTDKQSLNCKSWEYIPFNFRQDQRAKELIKEIKNNLVNLNLYDSSINLNEDFLNDLLKKWDNEQIQNAIKCAYKKINGSINTNSMVLFSGVKKDNVRSSVTCCNQLKKLCKLVCCNNKPNGCLYTGDYDAKGKQKWKELKKAYQSYFKYIGCIQIPHHGSSRSYNEEIASFDAYCIVSAGKTNKYRHPNESVLKSLLNNGIHPFIVTEEKSSEVVIKIDD